MEVGSLAGYSSFLYAILAAIFIAVIGYLKKIDNPEDFDKQKFIRTIIIGTVVGVIMYHYKMDYPTAYTYLLSIGGIILIDYLLKLAWRWYEQITYRYRYGYWEFKPCAKAK